MFLFFDDPVFSADSVGKKAENLQRLFSAGFPVPHGFVIPSQHVNVAEIADVELQKAIFRIGGFPVAVRSSGQLEDLEGASFAGQYKTYLNVTDIEELRKRIQDCQDSGGSEMVRAYLAQKGLSTGQNPLVSVLVQPMVKARHAGVAFSIDPLTGKEEHALVECCERLGESLVSGQVSPSRYVMDLFQRKTLEFAPGDNKTEPSQQALEELTQHILAIQAHFGQPQDIEWAVSDLGKVWILQSRPITRIEWRKESEEWTNADFKDGGVSARVCTPMMFALYRNAMQLSMQSYGVDVGLLPKNSEQLRWIESFYGRPYWNASTVKRMMSKVPGFDEEEFDRDLGIQKKYGSAGPIRVKMSPLALVGAVPLAIGVLREYGRQRKTVRRYSRKFLRKENQWRKVIQKFESTSDDDFFKDLVRVVQEFHLETESSYFRTIYSNSNIQSDFKKLLKKIDAATGETTQGLKLMCGLEGISHLEIQTEIYKLYRISEKNEFESKEWKDGLTAFISRLYYHADAELDLTCARWGERPERIESMIRDLRQSGATPVSPEVWKARQALEFSTELSAIRARIGKNWLTKIRFKRTFEGQLRLMREYLVLREQMRDYSTRCYAIVRQYLLEAGRRLAIHAVLAKSEDVFMLLSEELVQICKPSRSFLEAERWIQPRVAYRQALYQGYRKFQPPNEFGQGITQVQPLTREELNTATTSSSNLILKGLGCSPGIVQGKARVIHSLDEIWKIQKDEILVTRFTDPGWTPVLGIVSGVVTEVGGLLSHAAVISRELGIPAILNIPGVTSVLNGQQIEIDGSLGTVRVLNAVI